MSEVDLILSALEIKMTINEQIKEMVRLDREVHFMFYRNGELWYKTETGFEFPVPISDCGDAAFNRDDKALLFMRYIRKHLEYLEKAKDEFV